MKTTTIDFVDNATTREAGIYAVRYGWAFVKGVYRRCAYRGNGSELREHRRCKS